MQPEQNGHEHDGGQYRPRSGSGLSGNQIEANVRQKSRQKIENRRISTDFSSLN